MINITTRISSKGQLLTEVEKIIEARYDITEDVRKKSVDSLKEYIKDLQNELWFFIEHPYVDKLYRDTYYQYYSSKLDNYSRDSIKISIFSMEPKLEDFRSNKLIETSRQSYLGFLTLRPTFPTIIGRSVISPKAFVKDNFVCCQADFDVTANGVKFKATGFPHASQDAETVTCAETTIWSIIEYFSHRYPEYKPILPSNITKIINQLSVERLIPSKGLSAVLISYALKELGFGVKMYARNAYGTDFELLLKTYIESGIPVVAGMSNAQGVGHAFNIIGHQVPDESDIDHIQITERALSDTLTISDYYTMPLKYVFIDDNYPPYQMTTLDNPSAYYTSARWQACEINMFIAPLYPKIYLEADTARKLSNSYVKQYTRLGLLTKSEVVTKTFLASSRSYKEYVALQSGIEETAKELLLDTSMPKFIWVTELSDIILLKKGLSSGVIIIDATEPKQEGVVAALLDDKYLTYDSTKFHIFDIPLHPFNIYINNLK